MEAYDIAFALLRRLCNMYDEGGISGRAPKSILVEAVFQRQCKIDPRVSESREPIATGWEQLDTYWNFVEACPADELQFVLFDEALYLQDHEYRLLAISWVLHILTVQQAMPDMDVTWELRVMDIVARALGLRPEHRWFYQKLIAKNSIDMVRRARWIRELPREFQYKEE